MLENVLSEVLDAVGERLAARVRIETALLGHDVEFSMRKSGLVTRAVAVSEVLHGDQSGRAETPPSGFFQVAVREVEGEIISFLHSRLEEVLSERGL